MLAYEFSRPPVPMSIFGLAEDGSPAPVPTADPAPNPGSNPVPAGCPPCPRPEPCPPCEPREPVAGAWLAASFIALGLIGFVVVQTMRGRLL